MVQSINKTHKDRDTTSELLRIVEILPENLIVEVLHYAEYLSQKSSEQSVDSKSNMKHTPENHRKSLAGCLKGTFVLPLPDDFNEPLDEFAEYM